MDSLSFHEFSKFVLIRTNYFSERIKNIHHSTSFGCVPPNARLTANESVNIIWLIITESNYSCAISIRVEFYLIGENEY